MRADERFRELLAVVASPVVPDERQVDEARAALHDTIRASAGRRHRPSWRPSLVGGVAAAAIVVLVAIMVFPGSAPEVDASLAQIARATRDLSPQELPEGSYVYAHTESVDLMIIDAEDGALIFYLLPRSDDSWTQGNSEERSTTVGMPEFFDANSEAAYYAGGYGIADGVGETRVERFGETANLPDVGRWSTDVDTLRRQIEDELTAGFDPGLGRDIRIVRLVVELMEPPRLAPPGLRAGLLDILAGLDVEAVELEDGGVAVTLEYVEPGVSLFRQELTFDAAGYLRSLAVTAVAPEPGQGVPAGTVTSRTSFGRPQVVDGPGVFPDGR